jgi:transcriptional regulator with XRE-family HTH domain
MTRRVVETDEPNIVDLYVGTRFRKRRKQLDLSVGEIATALEVTKEEINCYEFGEKRIQPSTLIVASGILKVEIGYFFNCPNYIAALRNSEAFTQELMTFIETPGAMDVVRLYINLGTEIARNRFTEVIREIAMRSLQ